MDLIVKYLEKTVNVVHKISPKFDIFHTRQSILQERTTELSNCWISNGNDWLICFYTDMNLNLCLNSKRPVYVLTSIFNNNCWYLDDIVTVNKTILMFLRLLNKCCTRLTLQATRVSFALCKGTLTYAFITVQETIFLFLSLIFIFWTEMCLWSH